jgi:hypothetical protein
MIGSIPTHQIIGNTIIIIRPQQQFGVNPSLITTVE